LPAEDTHRNLTLFAGEVMPRLRRRFGAAAAAATGSGQS
jgi:hypothetical protein